MIKIKASHIFEVIKDPIRVWRWLKRQEELEKRKNIFKRSGNNEMERI